jgi:uncharacterized protein (DUF1330 family)
MKSGLKITVAVACGLVVGGGAVQMLHAQSKPPAFVVAEITVRDLEGYEMNFLKPAQKTIADHGGKYLAGGFNKTLSLAGTEPPNRVVLLQFANMDAVKAWRNEGEADLENDVGEKYAKFRVYAVEGVTQ